MSRDPAVVIEDMIAEIDAIGNILRHEHDRVSSKVLWDLVRSDLAPLRTALEALLNEQKPS